MKGALTFTKNLKVLGSKTGRPVIRLDATDLRKKYVGEGEAKLATAIELVLEPVMLNPTVLVDLAPVGLNRID